MNRFPWAEPPEGKGYRRGTHRLIPPAETRWKPGQSGNPKGRPKGAATSFERVLEQELEREVEGDPTLGDEDGLVAVKDETGFTG